MKYLTIYCSIYKMQLLSMKASDGALLESKAELSSLKEQYLTVSYFIHCSVFAMLIRLFINLDKLNIRAKLLTKKQNKLL